MWEYRSWHSQICEEEEFIAELNKLGKDRWEVVSIRYPEACGLKRFDVILKRRIIEYENA